MEVTRTMRGRGRGRRGRGCGRRAAGMLESALLLLLHRDAAHGYTLLEQLEEFDLGGVDPSAIYRALRDMEAREWVTSTWDEEQSQGPPRRVYRITTLATAGTIIMTSGSTCISRQYQQGMVNRTCTSANGCFMDCNPGYSATYMTINTARSY